MQIRHFKIAACVVLVLLWLSLAAAQDKHGKQKSGPYHSSIQVPPSEKDQAKLQAAAKVSPDQVKAAAIEKHTGWPVKYVTLKNIKGDLVYEVEFKDDVEMFFDAGTGELLTKAK